MKLGARGLSPPDPLREKRDSLCVTGASAPEKTVETPLKIPQMSKFGYAHIKKRI